MIASTQTLSPSRSALKAREVSLTDLQPRDIERWSALAKGALDPNPFFEPEFLLPSARHLGAPRVSLIVVEDVDGWRACMPVQRMRFGGFIPIVRTWCHLYSYLGTPLLDGESAGAAAAARALLQRAVARTASPLVLERQGDGAVADALRQGAEDLGLEAVFEESHERALLPRQQEQDCFETLSRRRRQEFDRLARRLEEAVGSPVTVADESGDDAALDAFLDLERSGWKGRAGTALASDARHADFFREVGRAFAARDRLELLTLRAGDRRAAMACNLYAGEGGFCFKVAHEGQLRQFSPGAQLERASMRLFHEQRTERWQDSCADPDNALMNRLWPGRRTIATTVLARKGLPASVARKAIPILDRRRANRRSES